VPTRPIDRILFAQGGACFFCEDPLPKAEASIEHLVASANGGTNSDGNCVVCCRAMNALLDSMSLKEKIRVVLKQQGRFKCPMALRKPPAKPGKAPTKLDVLVAHLRRIAKPKTVKKLTSTIQALFQKAIAEDELTSLLEQLKTKGVITVEGVKVIYADDGR
jgi:hypothetical protein